MEKIISKEKFDDLIIWVQKLKKLGYKKAPYEIIVLMMHTKTTDYQPEAWQEMVKQFPPVKD